MHDKIQIKKLNALVDSLYSKSITFEMNFQSGEQILQSMPELQLSQLYSIRMAIDAISTSAKIYTHDFDRFFKFFDNFYNTAYQELRFIDDDEVKFDISHQLDEFRIEYKKINSKFNRLLM